MFCSYKMGRHGDTTQLTTIPKWVETIFFVLPLFPSHNANSMVVQRMYMSIHCLTFIVCRLKFRAYKVISYNEPNATIVLLKDIARIKKKHFKVLLNVHNSVNLFRLRCDKYWIFLAVTQIIDDDLIWTCFFVFGLLQCNNNLL